MPYPDTPFVRPEAINRSNTNLFDDVLRTSVFGWKPSPNDPVIKTLRSVDRADFVPLPTDPVQRKQELEEVYANSAIDIGYDATCSQPSMVAFMVHQLRLRSGQNVLGIGTGCGYADAVARHLIGEEGHLTTIEIVPELAAMGEANLRWYFQGGGAQNITFIVGNGSRGFSPHAPFDAIYVAATFPAGATPIALLEQLADGGRLICPEQVPHSLYARVLGHSHLCLYERQKDAVERTILGEVAFVPLQ